MFPNGGSTGLEKNWLHPYKKRTKSLNNYQMIDKALLMIKMYYFEKTPFYFQCDGAEDGRVY